METKWKLDPTHSELKFKVKHMMISNVTGTFKKFDVEATTDADDFTKAKITATADVNSIDTNNEQRDNHLKTADFFETDKHPQAKFESTSISKKQDDVYEIKGNLTIRGTTKPVTLNAEFGGIGKDPYGNVKAGFTIDGKINRKDFGLTWNAPLETGGILVGDELKIQSEVQLVKQQ